MGKKKKKKKNVNQELGLIFLAHNQRARVTPLFFMLWFAIFEANLGVLG